LGRCFLLYIIILNNILYSKEINFVYHINYNYDSDSQDYYYKDATINNLGFSALAAYFNNKIKIETSLGYNIIHGSNNARSDFTPTKGLDWIRKDPGLGKSMLNYYVSDMKLEYGDSSKYFFLNKSSKHWGPGIRSLTISNKVPSFPHFGFKLPLNLNFVFEYFHGQLQSNIEDLNYNYYYSKGKAKQVNRNVAGHQLSIKLFKKTIITLSEIVIYSNRSLELGYLLPFVPFFPIQNYLNDIDNILINIDYEYEINKTKLIYTSFLMDEWSPPYTFSIKNHNWFGYQLGLDFSNNIINKDNLLIEFTWTDHRIYHHRFMVNDAYSWGYPLGFWAGPHAQELYLNYNFPYYQSQVQIEIYSVKRGEYTNVMRNLQYESNTYYKRFGDNSSICDDCTGAIESKNKFSISIFKTINKKIKLNLKYSYIFWENAGFNPLYPVSDIDIPEVIKNSFSVNFNYIF